VECMSIGSEASSSDRLSSLSSLYGTSLNEIPLDHIASCPSSFATRTL
jgi:hypothetical protein